MAGLDIGQKLKPDNDDTGPCQRKRLAPSSVPLILTWLSPKYCTRTASL
jgi:hypothetical protein